MRTSGGSRSEAVTPGTTCKTTMYMPNKRWEEGLLFAVWAQYEDSEQLLGVGAPGEEFAYTVPEGCYRLTIEEVYVK